MPNGSGEGRLKMQKLNIEFDLDGVLIDYHSCLEKFLADRMIKMIPTGNFHFQTEPEIPPERLQRLIYKAMWEYDRINPFPEVPSVLKELYNMTGDPIRITTARPYHVAHPTMDCIEKALGPIPFSVSFVSSGTDKHKFLTKGCYIDDRRRTCLDLAKRGFTVFMPERDYNMPIGPEDGVDFCYRGKWEISHRFFNIGKIGNIIIIEDLECLLYPENLSRILS